MLNNMVYPVLEKKAQDSIRYGWMALCGDASLSFFSIFPLQNWYQSISERRPLELINLCGSENKDRGETILKVTNALFPFVLKRKFMEGRELPSHVLSIISESINFSFAFSQVKKQPIEKIPLLVLSALSIMKNSISLLSTKKSNLYRLNYPGKKIFKISSRFLYGSSTSKALLSLLSSFSISSSYARNFHSIYFPIIIDFLYPTNRGKRHYESFDTSRYRGMCFLLCTLFSVGHTFRDRIFNVVIDRVNVISRSCSMMFSKPTSIPSPDVSQTIPPTFTGSMIFEKNEEKSDEENEFMICRVF